MSYDAIDAHTDVVTKMEDLGLIKEGIEGNSEQCQAMLLAIQRMHIALHAVIDDATTYKAKLRASTWAAVNRAMTRAGS